MVLVAFGDTLLRLLFVNSMLSIQLNMPADASLTNTALARTMAFELHDGGLFAAGPAPLVGDLPPRVVREAGDARESRLRHFQPHVDSRNVCLSNSTQSNGNVTLFNNIITIFLELGRSTSVTSIGIFLMYYIPGI